MPDPSSRTTYRVPPCEAKAYGAETPRALGRRGNGAGRHVNCAQGAVADGSCVQMARMQSKAIGAGWKAAEIVAKNLSGYARHHVYCVQRTR